MRVLFFVADNNFFNDKIINSKCYGQLFSKLSFSRGF